MGYGVLVLRRDQWARLLPKVYDTREDAEVDAVAQDDDRHTGHVVRLVPQRRVVLPTQRQRQESGTQTSTSRLASTGSR